MPVVDGQQEKPRYLLDECANRWRTTEKLVIERGLMMLRYHNPLFESFKELKMKYTHTKKDAIYAITSAAKEYKKRLDGRNYLFIYRDRKNDEIGFFETLFLPRNYQHLTGVEFVDAEGNVQKNAVFFYRKCLAGKLKENEIRFKSDGTTPLKLEALPKLIEFLRFSKMTAIYNGMRPRLAVDRVAGTINYCLGFTKERDYYVPSSCLLEDVRKLGDNPAQILAIMSKEVTVKRKIYTEINYVAKGVPFNKLLLPQELRNLISLENYVENKTKR